MLNGAKVLVVDATGFIGLNPTCRTSKTEAT